MKTSGVRQVLHVNAEANKDSSEISESKNELDELFKSLETQSESSGGVGELSRDEVEAQLALNAPSDFQIRMGFLGITPLTIAGFVLAGVLIACNTFFGAGWLGDILGMNDGSESFYKNTNENLSFRTGPMVDESGSIRTIRLDGAENIL